MRRYMSIELGPIERLYARLQQTQCKGKQVLFLHVGDFYEVLGHDAPIIAQALGLSVYWYRGMPMTAFPDTQLMRREKELKAHKVHAVFLHAMEVARDKALVQAATNLRSIPDTGADK